MRALAAFLVITATAGGQAAEEQPVDGSLRVRVLSYNIHHAEGVDRRLDLPRIADLIKSVEPDLVALQEVDRGTDRDGLIVQYRFTPGDGSPTQITADAYLLHIYAEPGPVVVEAVVDPHEPPMPPKVSLEQSRKFAESLLRGTPNRDKIALTVLSDKVRELL